MTQDRSVTDQARQRAAEAGIPLVVKDVSARFGAITEYFLSEYACGRTPAPCTLCNAAIKWPSLVAEADRMGIRAIATGHYFNTERYNGRTYAARADDRSKDQSYYLWGLPQSTLERIVTPMGHLFKSDLMKGSAQRRESMGICFLKGTSCRQYISAHRPDTLRQGNIVDTDGNIIGRHDGTAFYTIGQKRGLDIPADGRCIVAIDARSNTITVGEESRLYYTTLEAGLCNIVDMEELLTSNDVEAVIRGIGRNPQGFARCTCLPNGRIRIDLDSPAWAPAAGQPVVFYRGNRVIGGGIVEKYR